jgi:hypothetical protein
MDEQTPISAQMLQECGRVVLINMFTNMFTVEPEDCGTILEAVASGSSDHEASTRLYF